jgi:hypothetical protein
MIVWGPGIPAGASFVSDKNPDSSASSVPLYFKVFIGQGSLATLGMCESPGQQYP